MPHQGPPDVGHQELPFWDGPYITPHGLFGMLLPVFGPDAAVAMTAVSMAESGDHRGGLPGADNLIGEESYGLFQVNLDAWSASFNREQLLDPQQAVQAARQVYDSQGFQAWRVTHPDVGTPYRKYLPAAIDAAAAAGYTGLKPNTVGSPNGYKTRTEATGSRVVQPGQSVSVGSSPVQSGGGGSGGGGGFLPAVYTGNSGFQRSPGSNNDQYPSGGELLSRDGELVLRFGSNGAFVDFNVSDVGALQRSGYQTNTAAGWYAPDGGLDPIRGGDASELGDLRFDTFEEVFESALDSVFRSDNPARNDPGVRHLVLDLAVNNLSIEQFQWRLQGLPYSDRINQTAAAWNDFTTAEQDRRVGEQSGAWAQRFRDALGDFSIRNDDSRIQDLARAVESGRITRSQADQHLRDLALQNPNSPISRAQRNEGIQQRQWDADLENTAGSLKDQGLQWGLDLSYQDAGAWAEDIRLNVRTQNDFNEMLKDAGEAIFPGKNREIRTDIAASPWLRAYENTLESGPQNLSNIDVLSAISAGESLNDFGRRLRNKPQWLHTENANDTVSYGVGRMSQAMGFN